MAENGLYGTDQEKAGAPGDQHTDMGVASGENFDGAVEKAVSLVTGHRVDSNFASLGKIWNIPYFFSRSNVITYK